MSFTFTVAAPEAPDLRELLAALPYDDVEVAEGLPEEGWPPQTWWHLLRPRVSCRTVELGYDADGFSVRCFTSSSVDDYLLALAVVRQVASASGVDVHDENGEVVAVADFDDRYDGFATHMAEWGAELIPRVLGQTDVQGPLTLPGPGRPFVVGERLLRELKPNLPGFVDRFYDRQRTVRWFDPEGTYYHSTVMVLDREDGVEVKLTAMGPGCRYLMPDVAFFALHTDAGPPCLLPAEHLPDLVEVEWLDEKQFITEGVAAEDWEGFLAAAWPLSRPLGC